MNHWSLHLSCLVANDLSRVTFLVFFDVDSVEGVADSGGGGGGELGGVAMCLLKNKNIN